MEELNKRVLEVIQWSQLSKTEFALRTGVAIALLSHIASGRNKPGVELLQKLLSEYPQLNAAWLLTGNGPMLLPEQQDTTEQQELLLAQLENKLRELQIELKSLELTVREHQQKIKTR